MRKINLPPQTALYIGGAVGVIALGYVAYRFIKSPFETEGTPYEGAGSMGGLPAVVGGLAAATNRLSGGTLAQAGGALGSALYDLVGEDFRNGDSLSFTFKDGPHSGKKGAVDADTVNQYTGEFTYFRDGGRYILKKDASGARFATVVK